jgi:hypothetical protein
MSWGSWNVDAIRRQIHEVARELVVTGDGDGNVHGHGRGHVNGQGRGQADDGSGAEGAAVAGRGSPGTGIGVGIGVGIGGGVGGGVGGGSGNDNVGSSFQTVATRDVYNHHQHYNSTEDEHGDDEDDDMNYRRASLKMERLDDPQAEGANQRKGLDVDNDSDADPGNDNTNDDDNVGVSGGDDGNPPFLNSHSILNVAAQKDRYRFQEQHSHRQEQPKHAAHTNSTRDSKLRPPHAPPSSADNALLSSSPMPPPPSPPSALSSVAGDNSVIIGSSNSGPSVRVSEDIAFLKIELAKSQSSLAMLRAHLIEQQRDSESTILEMKVHLSEEQERRQYLEGIAVRVPQLESELAQLQTANDSLRSQSASVEQLVEQFHVDKENDFQLRSFHLKQELEALSDANKQLRGELQAALDERDSHASAQGRLELVESQLVHATSANNQLRQELERLRRNLDEVAGELASNTQTREDLVDKRVVVKLITTYFQQQTAANKTQVLDLMSRILNFSDNEKRIVGLLVGGSTGGNGGNNVIHNAGRRSWLSSIFSGGGGGGGGGGGATASIRGDHNSGGDGDTANQSLSALWVKFLVDQAEDATEAEAGTGTGT